MKKNLVVIIVLLVIAGAVGLFLINKPAQKPAENKVEAVSAIKKVDLSTQPEWVQKLVVTAKKGVSANGLPNVTVKVSGFPDGVVSSLDYVLQYETTNKGTQGALSTTKNDMTGKKDFTKVIDLGTCSTKSCVRHEGVTSVELELDFITTSTSGDQPIWTGTLQLQ